MNRTNPRVLRSRKKLADALISLLLEHGYEKLTVAAVTKRSKVAHSTIYRHYKSLDDLLAQILGAAFQEMATRVSQQATLYGKALAFYTFVKERPDLCRVFLALPPSHAARQTVSAESAKVIDVKCEQQDRTQAPFTVSVEHVLEASNRMMSLYLANIDDYTPEQIASMHCDLVINGAESARWPNETVGDQNTEPAPARRKLNPRVARSRQKLGDALCSVGLEAGYENLSIAAVTKRAKVGYATFFRHFRNLDELLNYFMRAMMQEIAELLEEQETLYDESIAWFIYIRAHEDRFRFYVALPDEHPARDIMKDATVEFIIERYEPRDASVVPLEVAVNQLVESMYAFLRWYLDYGAGYTPEQAALFWVNLVLKTTESNALSLREDWLAQRPAEKRNP